MDNVVHRRTEKRTADMGIDGIRVRASERIKLFVDPPKPHALGSSDATRFSPDSVEYLPARTSSESESQSASTVRSTADRPLSLDDYLRILASIKAGPDHGKSIVARALALPENRVAAFMREARIANKPSRHHYALMMSRKPENYYSFEALLLAVRLLRDAQQKVERLQRGSGSRTKGH